MIQIKPSSAVRHYNKITAVKMWVSTWQFSL